MASQIRKLRAKLHDFALALPEATEAMPWGERVVKVNKKVFVFLGRDMDPHFGFSLKLPTSKQAALALPFCEPTGYGLGKSGWVSVKLEAGAELPFEQLRDWLLESYCAVASKTLAGRIDKDSSARASAKPVRKTKTKVAAKELGKPRTTKTAKAAPTARGKAKSVTFTARTSKRAAKA